MYDTTVTGRCHCDMAKLRIVRHLSVANDSSSSTTGGIPGRHGLHRSRDHDHVRVHHHANKASIRRVARLLTTQRSKQLFVSFEHLRPGGARPCMGLITPPCRGSAQSCPPVYDKTGAARARSPAAIISTMAGTITTPAASIAPLN